MKLTWFGHACFKVDFGSHKILIDPFLTGNEKFTESGHTLDEVINGVNYVVLTHGHDDHVGDTIDICKKTGATLIATFELAMYLNTQGVENIDLTNTGGTVDYKEFKVSFVNALHSSATFVDDKPVYLGPACGVILTSDQQKTLYHMGDTDIFSDMALIHEIYKPDIGLVPIGDRFTMGAKTASLACKKFFNFKTVIPCHYGTFPIIDQDASKFIAEMQSEIVLVPKIGQEIEL
ncbi:MAG: metal-dependent hydrolase [Pseudomonadota bacterium]